MKDENKMKRQLVDELLKTRQQLAEYGDILNVIPDIVYKIDPDGHFLYINSSVKDLGYSPEELIGKHFSKIIHPNDVTCVSRAAVLQRYKGTVTGDERSPKLFDERRTEKRGTKSLAIRLIAKNWKKQEDLQDIRDSKKMYGEVMASGQYDRPVTEKDKTFLGTVGTIRDCEIAYAELSSSSQYDVEVNGTEEKHQGTVGIIRDVTERMRFEQEKAKVAERLHHARKMEAIGQLAGGIAHDLNNLLMGIQGNVSLIHMDMDSTHLHYKRLKNIEKQVQSGAKLTSHLLGYARKGKYEIKPVDLNQLVEETSETFGRTKKEITIHRELAGDLFTIKADRGQIIEQVLLNLFINAADAMPGGGDLILKTMNTTHNDMKGKLYDPKPGNYVLLTVTDTGIGMDTETMECIFDPFFTTKEMGRGTGLGLASAYGIMKGHGGCIDVESTKGQGTTFSIYLPASGKKVQKRELSGKKSEIL